MMKTNIYKIFRAGLVCCGFTAALTACSDDFLAEKRPYGSFSENDVYADWESVKLRLNYIYQSSLPSFRDYNSNGSSQGGNSTATNNAPDIWPVGLPDFLSTNGDEFAGYGNKGYGYFSDPAKVWDNTNIFKFFYYGVNESPWKKMRECTDVIVKVRQHDGLTDLQKNYAEGQARFFRATRYFRLFKRFGGTPIVRGLQSTTLSDTTDLRIARHSTQETFDFIIEDLTTAASMLPARWDEEVNDWGRVTAGTALALAGYVANYYASPVFNRADEQARWDSAYVLNKRALEVLAAGHFGLSYEGDPGKNASNWAKIWCNIYGGDNLNSEAVYMANCNNASGDAGDQLYNCTEQKLRPANCGGGGGITPSAEMVDAFPMADGKRPTEAGEYQYDKKLFFLNRDPRFYRTFAFPGTEWQFLGSITGDVFGLSPYGSGVEYQLQQYAWYPSVEEALDVTRSGYYSDLMAGSGNSIYVRKKSQDYALGMTPMYVYEPTSAAFQRNGQPLIAMRYTEVLLNFAEAACGANHLDEAWDALIKIRQRVGYEGDCGLDPAIRGDRAKMFEAILFERRIELAYEGKRFDDCHRWMLFDGGVGQDEIEGAPATWTLTGFGGNTCQYLGVTPLNDVSLHRIELYIDPAVYMGSRRDDADPFTLGTMTKPKALTLNEDFTTTVNTDTEEIVYANANVKALAEWYMNNLQRKDIVTQTTMNADETDYATGVWDKKCYLMGLQNGDEENSPNVAQTIGWASTFGGMGHFDPLSLTPDVSPNRNVGGR
ncbi:MAG: RagB/SusD family nutrient uptake outer membrane protein [Prevotella sp.]|nr:RagB/SusD family nutrient uptake outer membrane protein [Prevotella sp.]